jgi:hypothetical protein
MARLAQLIRVLAVADCFTSLRTILFGGLIALVALRLAFGAAKNGSSEAVRRSRRAAALLLVAAVLAGTYLLAFDQSCARQASCGVAWDLSCTPPSRAIFHAGARVAAVLALGAVVAIALPRQRSS